MKNTINNCNECQNFFADLLLDADSLPESVRSALQKHMDDCADCTQNVTELRGTFAKLDSWTAPEPSAYFDTRLHARLREAQAAKPEGFFERVRSFLLFSTGRELRPAVGGALALVLVLSGGSFIGIHGMPRMGDTARSATVEDLRVLDSNAQALQQMDQLLDDSTDDSNDATPTT